MQKILIANRGEIAVRVVRACRELGIRSVAVYSDADRAAPHVRHADEACAIGGDRPAESYLSIDRLIDVARTAGADAIHPGYGFLSENAAFARACRDSGITFIGPSADVIDCMGSKTAARAAAIAAGVPVVPGSDEPFAADVEVGTIARAAAAVGYPLLVKAVAGGGGKGMRLVADEGELPSAVRAARSEASSSFGDATIYLERRLTRPRHVEVQVLGDGEGHVVPFVERECSIQRRHQKVVEESPSVAVTPDVRRQLATAAQSLASRVRYGGAGTLEFLLDADGRFYFLEMNTRLQVEHPITEAVTGVDLVHWQIRIARGEALAIDREQALTPRGHAIECRIYAEDPDRQFLPSPGRILALHSPGGPGIRDDSGVAAGFVVPIDYDPLLSKLIAWAPDRPQAIARMARALDEYAVTGIQTTIPFFRWLMANETFRQGIVDTTFLDRLLASRDGAPFVDPGNDLEPAAFIAAALHRVDGASSALRVDDTRGSSWRRLARSESLRS